MCPCRQGAALQEERDRLRNNIKSIDFYLDEFGCGYAAVHPKAGPADVVEAVQNAMTTLRVKLAKKDKRGN